MLLEQLHSHLVFGPNVWIQHCNLSHVAIQEVFEEGVIAVTSGPLLDLNTVHTVQRTCIHDFVQTHYMLQ